MSITQEINFVGKLEEDDDGTMFFFCLWKAAETILSFSLDSLIVTEQ